MNFSVNSKRCTGPFM